MSRKKLWAAAAVSAVLLVWLFQNASLSRLRAEFIPWMHRLERYRDALERTRAALRTREAAPADPDGMGALRTWAWADLDHIVLVSFDVAGKPEIKKNFLERWTLVGKAVFVVDGFREDGARVERTALVALSVLDADVPEGAPLAFSATLLSAESERIEPRPRFHDATREAGLGAPRRDPPQKLTNRLIDGIWPGSGVAVLDFDQDGDEDLFVGDGVRSILYENDGKGHFTDVTVRAGLAASESSGIAATGVAAGDVDGDGYPDLVVTDAFGPTRLFRNRRDGTFEEITASSGIATEGPTRSAAFADVNGDGNLDLFVCGTGDYYRQMPDPPFDANDGRRNYL